MKKAILLSLGLLINLYVFAQDDPYITTMKNTLAGLDTATTLETQQSLANKFERIAIAENEKWLPAYYSAYVNILITFQIEDGELIDRHLDKAETFINQALEQEKKESELHALQAMMYQARIKVNPTGRGMVYSTKADKSLQKAEKYNENNPRIYFLRATSTLYTPEMFGGGKEKACPIFRQALEKFNAFEAIDEISPGWGQKPTEEYLKMCE